MSYEHIDPFINANLRVLGRTFPNVRQGEATFVRGDQVEGEVRVALKISGDSEGDVILSMDTAAAIDISSNLLNAKVASLTPLALDALAELGNMITGNAVSEMNDRGYDFRMNAPVVTVGGDNTADRPERKVVRIPVHTDYWEMNLNIMLDAD